MPLHITLPVPPGGFDIPSRVDGITRIPASSLVAAPPPPARATVELTTACNYRCEYCARGPRPEARGEMSWPLYTRVVGEMADAGVGELGLDYFGEPFLCDWLPDAVGYAKARGIGCVSVATNGSVATPERVAQCMAAGLDVLTFSFNSADGAQFQRVSHARPGLLRDAVAKLQSARRVRDDGAHSCALHASSIRGGAWQEERMQGLLEEILPYVDEHYWRALYVADSGEGERRLEPCWSLFTEAHVSHDGKLAACGFEGGEHWAMADLATTPFVEGWHAERFRKLREAHLRRDLACTACEDCAVYR